MKNTLKEVLAFSLLNTQLSKAEICETCEYMHKHVWHSLHVHGDHPYHPTAPSIDSGRPWLRFWWLTISRLTLKGKTVVSLWHFADRQVNVYTYWNSECTRWALLVSRNIPHHPHSTISSTLDNESVVQYMDIHIFGLIFYDDTLTGDRWLHLLQYTLRTGMKRSNCKMHVRCGFNMIKPIHWKLQMSIYITTMNSVNWSFDMVVRESGHHVHRTSTSLDASNLRYMWLSLLLWLIQRKSSSLFVVQLGLLYYYGHDSVL